MAGCQSTANNLQTEAETVASMEKVNNYDGLIAHYKTKLEAGDNSVATVEQLALAYFNKGDFESADFYVSHLIEQGSHSASLSQLHGQVLVAQEDISGAIQAYQDSLKAGNQTGKIHVLLGVAYSKDSQFQEAKAQFNQARLKGYDDVAVKNNIAMLYIAQNDFKRAIRTLAPVIADAPQNKVVRANLAIALIKADQIDAAKKLLSDEYSSAELTLITQQLSGKEI
ncbi:tetratricopeptide repeat protein [Vibrio sp. SCSIO 43140]|uniref:tetratricopeptide repeat protein n=1 Tax=Vibrio sp. SCSIO 43140 TaxID=2819100 RepID=UPI0020758E96|nr:tetratricopeptide repeat protein [Vibrio sp. SCSIO 43140]